MGVSLGNIEKMAGPVIARPARVILGELTKVGVDPEKEPMEAVLVLDHSGSMRDEYADGLVQQATERGLAFGATVDPDGKAQGIFFDSDAAEAREPIALGNFSGWVDRNRPLNMGGTNLAGAIRLTMEIAARELGVPAIAELVHRGRVDVREERTGSRLSRERSRKKFVATTSGLTPVMADRPAFAILITDGVPSQEIAAAEMLARSSFAPIFWKILFVSNQSEGLDFLKALDNMEGGFVDNANTVYFTSGLGEVTDQNFGVEVVRELDTWLAAARHKGLLKQR